jgi:hypothetical protein
MRFKWRFYAPMALCLLMVGCDKPHEPSPVVGTWLVHDFKAPFPMHMYVFNSDGTMQQANPDAGDAHGSDSDGKGIWTGISTQIRGKWVEVMADRATHQFTGRGEYSFEIAVSGNRLRGNGTMQLFDANGVRGGKIPTEFVGERVTLQP